MKTIWLRMILMLALSALSMPVLALDDAHRAAARHTLDRSIAYLLSQQDEQGAWSPKAGPAVTGLIVAGLLKDEKLDRNHPAIRKGIAYILSKQQPDGGIYESVLENYNTSICLMALGQVRDEPGVADAIAKAQAFLRGLQWSDQQDPSGKAIDKDHPWYGGAGYGNKGRPDLSNTAMMLAGLRDSGLDCKDPAYQRALTFITRLQGAKANTETGDQITPDGGFIYATSETKEKIGVLQSYAVPDRVTDSAGRSRLRTYGSMTYAGFMSYLYAQLDREDPRVQDAYNWLRHNYTLTENPNTGMQGYYYYLHLFSRAMSAWSRGESADPVGDAGETIVVTADGKEHDWANDLIDQLAKMQRADGSFVNEVDRWQESDPVLVTGYAVLALQHALRR